ncbi:MAG: thrombospondin type 3 repeat-containing protein, partial [Gammaproteobacteria bacterium]|nr:thrombospondin type 3 repeat-containing protein [Gammaproteobacteria bacterium]
MLYSLFARRRSGGRSHPFCLLVTSLFISVLYSPAALSQAVPVNEAQLTSNTTELNFGVVEPGEKASRRFVYTHNGGEESGNITLLSTWLNEKDALQFSTEFRGPVELAPGDSIAIEVNYQPIGPGKSVGALYLSHTGFSSLEVITLIGESTGTADLKLQIAPKMNPSFGKSLLNNIDNVKPTSLQFGPDGKLYVADMLGAIKVYTVHRNGSNNYQITQTETINLVKNITNHNDNGSVNSSVKNRLVTGLVVVGTSSNPIVYVSSSDPRIGGGPSHTDTNLDTNSGIISRLTKSNGSWQKLDLVRGLPRSEENHTGNGMAYDANTHHLYLAQGGHTNQGAPSNNLALLPEYALSAAILEIDLNQIGDSTYDLPTLNDENREGISDNNDPFGGNSGKNQAKLVPGGPVQVYAPGFRNPYDVVITSSGRMYSIDNGPNSGWGGKPANEGPSGNCTNAQSEPGNTQQDALHFIDSQGYYGGHPNPTRGNYNNTFNNSNPQSPVSASNPIECDYKGLVENNSLISWGTSTNGLTEYTASNHQGAMQGDLLTVGFNNQLQRVKLNASGSVVVSASTLFSNIGGIPLDVTAQSDADVFPGTIWVADFVDKSIVIYEPTDYDDTPVLVCQGGNGSSDEDGDGYTNQDEIANGTDPCSAGDIPNDVDQDFISDLTDSDDDNDGIADTSDVFPLDPDNGRGTDIPLSYTWENNSTPAGGLFNMGFTGLMNNGSTSYLDQFDYGNITAGGAAGVFTIDDVDNGDPVNGLNTQNYGFQFGIDVTPSTAPFTVRTRLIAPFSGSTPKKYMSQGLFIGTGDQDNYIKLVAMTVGADGGVQFAKEVNGGFSQVSAPGAAIFSAEQVDLFLTVDPATQSVTASYQSVVDGVTLARTNIYGTATFPLSWLTAPSGLAVGIISTSFGGNPFTATWDFIDISYVDGATDGGSTDSSDGSSDAGSDGGTDGSDTGGSDGA